LRDKTRKPGKKPLRRQPWPKSNGVPNRGISEKTSERGEWDAIAKGTADSLALPCGKPPRQATHWTGRMVAEAVGVSLRAVQRIWSSKLAATCVSAASWSTLTDSNAPGAGPARC
jgi:hypothetical protein